MTKPNVGYFAVKPNKNIAKALTSYLKSIGLKNPIRSGLLHITLMYSPTVRIDEDTATKLCKPDAVYRDINLKDIGLLGNDAVVVNLDSESLERRHEDLTTFLTHSYGRIHLHMSLAYFDDEEARGDALNLLKGHEKEIFKILEGITFSNEYFSELNG